MNKYNYVGVDNLLKDKQGKTVATYVPTEGSLIKYENKDTLVGNIRPYLKKIWFADVDGGTNGDVLVVRVNDTQIVMPKYLYHVLASDRFFEYDNGISKGAKMPRGDKKAILNFEVPILPLCMQECVVNILDKFELLVNNITQGLPAEIEARKKQYEYYRDKILSFKEKVA